MILLTLRWMPWSLEKEMKMNHLYIDFNIIYYVFLISIQNRQLVLFIKTVYYNQSDYRLH